MPGPCGIVNAKHVRFTEGKRGNGFRTHTAKTRERCASCSGRIRAKTKAAHVCKGK